MLPDSKCDSTKFARNGFVAEIISNPGSTPQIFHYLVQKEASTGIVYWGQEVSYQRALECIEDFLNQYDQAAKNA
jgi:hypothetical protein